MTNVSASDRNKAVGLIVAIVAVAAFLVLRILSITSPDAGAAPPVVQDSPPATSMPTIPATPPKIVSIVDPLPILGTDPFREVLDKPSVVVASVGGSGMRPSEIKGGFAPLLPPVDVEIPGLGPILVGVMSGDPAAGVFKIGDREEIAHVGDRLSNGFKVVSIETQSATLVRKDTKLNLTVGQPAPTGE